MVRCGCGQGQLYQSWLSWSLIRGLTWTDGTIDPGTARDWTDIHLNYNKRPMGKLCLPRRQLQLLSYQHSRKKSVVYLAVCIQGRKRYCSCSRSQVEVIQFNA